MRVRAVISIVLFVAASGVRAASPGTAFTYQGQLKDGGSPANGQYDLQFALFSDPVNNTQAGSTITLDNFQVANGLFTATLDFGVGIINGDALWLQVSVRPGASSGAFTTLTPRQKLTPAPYAIALALPYNGSASSAGALAALSQFGTGPGLTVTTSGVNNAVAGVIANAANNNAALNGSTNGSGYAVRGFNSGTGGAAYFEASNAASGGHAMAAKTTGSGDAVNAISTGSGRAVYAQTNNGGTPIYGYNVGTSGYTAFLRGENPSNSSPALRVEANGGTAGSFGVTAPGNSNSAVKGLTIGIGRAGDFEIINPASTSEALVALTTGQGNAISASANGGGTCISAIATGAGDGVYASTNGTGNGVSGNATSGGAGVRAHNSNSAGTALEIDQGAVKVTGMGVNSNTFAFIHKATTANITFEGHDTIIDHPMTNGHPDAVLFAIVNAIPQGQFLFSSINLFYSQNKWVIRCRDDTIGDGATFNVLVFTP